MQPIEVLERVIDPTFACVLPGRYASIEATAMLLAINQQEDPDGRRVQVVAGGRPGPARGLWQFEQGGGVRGVLNHEASRLQMRAVCLLRAVAPTPGDLHMALGHDDMLACAAARMLLWTDQEPLPKLGQVTEGWEYYLHNWRPGAYTNGDQAHRVALRGRWERNYAAALAALRQAGRA